MASLEVSRDTLREACNRLERTKRHLEEEEERFDELWRKKKAGKKTDDLLDACRRRMSNLKQAIQYMLPAAIQDAYRRYIWEYYTDKGLIDLPYDITSKVTPYLGSAAQRIRRQIEEEYRKRTEERVRYRV